MLFGPIIERKNLITKGMIMNLIFLIRYWIPRDRKVIKKIMSYRKNILQEKICIKVWALALKVAGITLPGGFKIFPNSDLSVHRMLFLWI